jgi:hypothetical protein
MKRGPKPKPPAVTVASGEVRIGGDRVVCIRRLTTGEDGADRLLLYAGWASGGGAVARSSIMMPVAMVGELVDALRAVTK